MFPGEVGACSVPGREGPRGVSFEAHGEDTVTKGTDCA